MHLVNGEHNSQISLLDRGVLYGHSVFETMVVHLRRPLMLDQHLERLKLGCERLGIPYTQESLRQDINTLIDAYSEPNCVLRVSQTMGVGGRGYLSPENGEGTRIVSAFAMPTYDRSNWSQGIVLGKVDIRLAEQPALAGIKHSNRLEQILARFEWQTDWHEALLLDKKKRVIEATQSNVFVVKNDELFTPDLSRQGVIGVMRQHIIEVAQRQLGIKCRVMRISLKDILNADEVFVTNSLIGLWPVKLFGKRQFTSFDLSTNLLNILIKNEVIPPI